MADFDWWSHQKLKLLTDLLPVQNLPGVSNISFWREAALACALGEDDDDAEELAQDVRNEVEGWQGVVEQDGVVFGDLNLAESRLMLMSKGIKGICYLASHQMDSLWREDGIHYHTLVVSPATEPGKTLAMQFPEVCAFIHAHQPALVCSSCPKLRTAVAAAMLLHRKQVPDVNSALAELGARAMDSDEPIGAAEREALDTFASGLVPPTSPMLTVKTQLSGSKRGETDNATPNSKSKCARLEADEELGREPQIALPPNMCAAKEAAKGTKAASVRGAQAQA